MNREKIIYFIISGAIALAAGTAAVFHFLPGGRTETPEIKTIPAYTSEAKPAVTSPTVTSAAKEQKAAAEITLPEAEEKKVTSDESSIVNLNTADREKLMTLRGIGEKKADLIIEYREIHNGFSCVEEITEVKGIGEKTLEKLRPNICV